mgnify:FL=1|tara:strand:+ start:123 stop:635 length:513 start_codon:yes stop_codon:yes gene_type:complete
MSIILKLPLMFTKKYCVLWPDLDANWHFANHSYIKYSADTRMSFFDSIGLTKDKLEAHMRGPVVFYEHMYYYKELKLEDEFIVSVEVDGYSDDQRFGRLLQNFYSSDGINLARLELIFGFIDLKTRTLSKFPDNEFEKFKTSNKTKSFKIMTKDDTRISGKTPLDIKLKL